jgi:hypothetical protein
MRVPPFRVILHVGIAEADRLTDYRSAVRVTETTAHHRT